MKKLTLIVFLAFTLSSFAQTEYPIINAYFMDDSVFVKVNHPPVVVRINDTAFTFFSLIEAGEQDNDVLNLYLSGENGAYSRINSDSFDWGFDNGIISVFTENIDGLKGKELIVIREVFGRTFYADGGYSGYRNYYQTDVFGRARDESVWGFVHYPAVSQMLTVNQPHRSGRRNEESFIGREPDHDKFLKCIGVTHNAEQVKKRIRFFKENGLLGGITQ